VLNVIRDAQEIAQRAGADLDHRGRVAGQGQEFVDEHVAADRISRCG
jgi:hypothetical protein